MKTYTRAEVSRHNGENGSTWIVIHNEVCDVTKFIEEHPGGEEVLIELAGKDATQCFDDIGHSDDAKNLRLKYVIGVIKEHPGGEEVLLEQAGSDATEAFEDVGHSTDAREMMTKYKVGDIVEEERKQNQKKTTWTPSEANDSNNESSWKSWLIPIVLGIVATMVYRFFVVKQ